jgi:hypothetical protein
MTEPRIIFPRKRQPVHEIEGIFFMERKKYHKSWNDMTQNMQQEFFHDSFPVFVTHRNLFSDGTEIS